MTKSVKRLILIIGAISLISGIYLAITGSDFNEFFFGILIGVSLIGSAIYYKDEYTSNNND